MSESSIYVRVSSYPIGVDMNIANSLTLLRILLTIPIAVIVDSGSVILMPWVVFFILAAYLSDTIDGIAARFLRQESLFGARFDIAGDRILDFCLWLIFIRAEVFPSIIGIIFIIRGILTDVIREYFLLQNGQSPFESAKNHFGYRVITAKWSRTTDSLFKILTFSMASVYLLTRDSPWANSEIIWKATQILGWVTLIFTFIRGLPVLLRIKEVVTASP